MPHVEQHNTFNQQWLTCHVLRRLNPLHTFCSHVTCRQHELQESGGTAYKESHLAMDVGQSYSTNYKLMALPPSCFETSS